MTEIMGVDVREYRWRPYPTRTFEQEKVFEIPPEEVNKLPEDKKKNIQRVKADYIGRLQAHRAEIDSHYIFLKDIRGQYEGDDLAVINELLEDHRLKEKNIDSLSDNACFRGLAYA